MRFCHASRYGAETWHGGRGWAHEVCGHIFEATPSKVNRSSRGQVALEMPYGYQIWLEESPTKRRNALLGSKVMQGSSGVNQGENCLEMPYGHQIWWEESLTKPQCMAGVKGHVGVSWGQVGVNLLSNALWPPNLVGRTPDHNLMHCWGTKVM